MWLAPVLRFGSEQIEPIFQQLKPPSESIEGWPNNPHKFIYIILLIITLMHLSIYECHKYPINENSIFINHYKNKTQRALTEIIAPKKIEVYIELPT